MPAYRDKTTQKWYCKFYYEDFFGEKQQKKKRGFERKKDAESWERDFLENHAKTPEITFDALVNKYLEDRKINKSAETYRARERDARLYYLPYFKGKKVKDISPLMIREWQNAMKQKKSKSGKPFRPATLKAIHVGLSAIFNFGVRFYGTPNPAAKAGSMGSSKSQTMEIYTLEEFQDLMKNAELKEPYRTVIEVLFWSGLRIGELLALHLEDLDFKNNNIRVNKTLIGASSRLQYHPKNERGFRTVKMPEKVMQNISAYLDRLYDKEGRIFMITNSSVRAHLAAASKQAGLHKIRVHDLRHSQASLMINLGYSVFAVADRLGDTPEMILKVYGHMYKNKEQELISEYDKLLTEK